MKDVLPIATRGAGVRSGNQRGSTPVATRIAVASIIGVAVFSALLLRLWALTVLAGPSYAEKAHTNQIRTVPVEAPRGAIVDRNRRPLVTNRAARQVVLDLDDVPVEERPRLYVQLARVLDMPVSAIRKRIARHAGDTLTPVVLVDDVQEDRIVYYLEEHGDDFPGVDIRDRYVRNYVGGSVAAHLLGQVGEVNAEQLKGEFSNLDPGDRVGQSGLERQYDEYLRGTDGYRAVEVDARGVRQGLGRGLPVTPGSNVRLSIDFGLQAATEKALREGVTIARKSSAGARASGGAAVAIDPRTGEVLALASAPTYDPNIFVTAGNDREIEQVLHDRRTPLSNRATGGLYPPGSTFKPITALAAMQEHFITPDTLISCPSYMEIAGTKFNNWMNESLGAMDVSHALEVSCDTFFYSVAIKFYNTPGTLLQDWARRFGLGRKTGVDMPGEESGLVPTPAWRRKAFDGWGSVWSPGHSVNLSIGQGDLLVTPLQMTMVYGAIANGGTLYAPSIATGVDDASGRQIMSLRSEQSTRINIRPDRLQAVRDGLYAAAQSSVGTSSAVFSSFPVPVSGKTGTAEKPPYGDMAWYCAYAPSPAPTIAACAIIESGGHGGTAAAPVVLRMFQQHFGTGGGNVTQTKASD